MPVTFLFGRRSSGRDQLARGGKAKKVAASIHSAAARQVFLGKRSILFLAVAARRPGEKVTIRPFEILQFKFKSPRILETGSFQMMWLLRGVF